MGKTATGALDVLRFFSIIKPSKSFCIGFPSLGFYEDVCPKNHVCPLSYVCYVLVNDLYMCRLLVVFTSIFFEYFLKITCIIKSQVGEVNRDTAVGFL